MYLWNVNPGLRNHGLLIGGSTPQVVIAGYFNGAGTPQLNNLGVYGSRIDIDYLI